MNLISIIYYLFIFSLSNLALSQVSNYKLNNNNLSYLSINADVAGAKIYIDTNFIGITPLDSIQIYPGIYGIHIIHPDERNWYREVLNDSVTIPERKHLKRYYVFQNIFYISSVPSGAGVFLEDSLLGYTPLIYKDIRSSLVLRLEKENYKPVETFIDRNNGSVHVNFVTLEPNELQLNNEYLSQNSINLPVSVYLAATGSLSFGLATALLKIKADDYYKQYRQTGDEDLLANVKKYDTLSGISLVACELSSVLLAYLLLTK